MGRWSSGLNTGPQSSGINMGRWSSGGPQSSGVNIWDDGLVVDHSLVV